MDQNAFQDVQIILINYLSKSQSREMEITTSCSLLLKWYEKMKIPIPDLPKGSEEEKIIFLIEILTDNATKVKKKCKNQSQSKILKRYKNFQIPSEITFPKKMTASGQHSNSIEGFGMIEKKNH
jgi:hypothetical protein